jgi:hypothetical protein
MTLGVVAPILVLIWFELQYFFAQKENPDYNRYQEIKTRRAEETVEQVDSGSQNKHGRKVISLGVMGTGVLILAIGIFAVTGKYLVIGTGAIVITIGLFVNFKKTKSE